MVCVNLSSRGVGFLLADHAGSVLLDPSLLTLGGVTFSGEHLSERRGDTLSFHPPMVVIFTLGLLAQVEVGMS